MLDLFKEIVPKENQSEFFKILLEKEYLPARNIIMEWSKGMELRKEKNNTLKQFQSSFESIYWEIYLNKVFRELGFFIDYTKDSPDFFLDKNGVSLNVEAVVANNAIYNKELKRDRIKMMSSLINDDRKLIDNESAIRLKSALLRKNKDYRKKHKEKSWVKDLPYVVAIYPNMGVFPSRSNNSAINQVLYGIGTEFIFDENTGIVSQNVVSSIENKKNKKNEYMGLFTDERCEDISAVIFSNTAGLGKAISQTKMDFVVNYRTFFNEHVNDKDNIINRDSLVDIKNIAIIQNEKEIEMGASVECTCLNTNYSENILSGLHIYHNPFAKNPLNKSLFKSKYITYNNFDVKSKSPIAYHPNGSLVNRIINPPNSEVLRLLLFLNRKNNSSH